MCGWRERKWRVNTERRAGREGRGAEGGRERVEGGRDGLIHEARAEMRSEGRAEPRQSREAEGEPAPPGEGEDSREAGGGEED